MKLERRYNRWAGNERGTAERPSYCIAEIYTNPLFAQCRRRRGFGPNDEYCAQHAGMKTRGRYVSVPDLEPPNA